MRLMFGPCVGMYNDYSPLFEQGGELTGGYFGN